MNNEDELFLKSCVEDATDSILKQMKGKKITKKKIYSMVINSLKKNTKPKPKTVKIARVPFYVSDSSD